MLLTLFSRQEEKGPMAARRPNTPSTRKAEGRQVFINCPFSDDYQETFRAIVFCVIRSGFEPRCALEADDGAENRLNKILGIIGQCSLAIHDISKTELDPVSRLPRFNMPLELGIFLGARRFGPGIHKRKRCIILDRERYRYQIFMSDIAGQDIHAYGGTAEGAISEIAAWLRHETRDPLVPGGKAITREFAEFSRNIPDICRQMDVDPSELTFKDFQNMTVTWIVRAANKKRPLT
jgi:hypothetical protein